MGCKRSCFELSVSVSVKLVEGAVSARPGEATNDTRARSDIRLSYPDRPQVTSLMDLLAGNSAVPVGIGDGVQG